MFTLAGVKLVSSQAPSHLLEARARLQPQEGRIAVSGLTPQLERVF